MIQDIQPERFDNHFLPPEQASPRPSDYLFQFSGRFFYGKSEERTGRISFPQIREICPSDDLIRLFSIDETRFYLRMSESAEDLAEKGYSLLPLRLLRKCLPQDLCYAGTIAYHLYVWYRDSRYCGRCGTPTVPSRTERALVCPSCGCVLYPRINPAVIIGVIRGDSILLTRYAGREYKGHALIAGFCEIGETAEGTVRREVMEEAGLHVRNIRYFASQPWGFESDLLLGFYCDALPGEEIRVDRRELDRARFVRREELKEESRVSLTSTMICHFRDGMM